MREKKVIFIGGSSYSGSTMLDMMLANSDQGFSAGEVHALFRPFRPHHFDPVCGCGDTNCRFWSYVKGKGENDLYETIFDFLPGVSYIVDSSKDPWWILRQERHLKKKGINFHNLLIWKEPDAFAHSMLKRKRKGWLKAWRNYYSVYLHLIDDYIPVAYKSLAENPEYQLKNLCGRLHIPFINNQHNFWIKKHHTLFGNRSAKVHLQHDYQASHEMQHADRHEKSRHRSIYCDVEYGKSLPDQISHCISSDFTVQQLVAVLKKDTSVSNAPRLGRLSLGKAKAKHQLQYALGGIFGRHFRIF